MKRLLARIIVYLLSFVVIVGGVGIVGFSRSQKEFWYSGYDRSFPTVKAVKIPEYNPNKPTVAVILGNVTTEVFDFMIPYEMFSRTDACNVFAVAPDKNVKRITGGLELIPHYSFKELDQLLGKSPDIIVIPYMTMVEKEGYQPVREWIQKHSSNQTTLLSICAGAENLADTGLLKGKSAAIHWQVFDLINMKYRETEWKRDQRYVVEGNIVSSAGLTSGIDAVLFVISQKLGEPMAEKIVKEMNYPTYQFVHNPKMDPYYLDLKYSIYLLNNAFQWNKNKTGVLLYNGMEEGALASVFDTYADTGTTNVFTISNTAEPIVTKHNLNLLARYQISNAPKLDKMIFPGTQVKTIAEEDIKLWNEKGISKENLFLHSDSPDRFVFEPALEDLAKQEDILTAKHATKRLEYRGEGIKLEGRPFSIETYVNLLVTIVISLLIANFIDRRFIMKKTITKFEV